MSFNGFYDVKPSIKLNMISVYSSIGIYMYESVVTCTGKVLECEVHNSVYNAPRALNASYMLDLLTRMCTDGQYIQLTG